MSTDTGRPARRTRLTPERERELYEATVELLREVGYDALTMDAVAARTRSSKATLYRQWGGKPCLVATALRETRPVRLEEVDTGSLAGDLRMLAQKTSCHAERDNALLRALAHAADRDPELGRVMRETLIEPEMQALRRMADRAVERGEVDADRPALAYLTEMLLGALVARPLIEDREPDVAYVEAYLDAVVLPALGLDG